MRRPTLTTRSRRWRRRGESSSRTRARLPRAFLRKQQAEVTCIRTRYAGLLGPEAAHEHKTSVPAYVEFEKILTAELEKERVLYEDTLQTMLAKDPNVFGDPLDFRKCAFNIARHAFWPANETRMPLFFFCATILLGGQLTSTENERFHNVAAYVINKFRASLSPENCEYYAVAKYLLVRDLKEPEDPLECADAADELLEYPTAEFEIK